MTLHAPWIELNSNTLIEIWLNSNSTIGLRFQLKKNEMPIDGEDIENLLIIMVLKQNFKNT
jgi:hypothetical protein